MKNRLQRWVLLLAALFPLVIAQAAVLEPTEKQHRATALITQFISNYHYKKTPLDDELSEAILERYIESLDPNRSFFIRSDIERFSRFRHTLDDSLLKARLHPAFEIFGVFQERLEGRVKYAESLLDSKFDFNVDEYYLFDRENAEWASTMAALDDIWRKRVKNDVLSLQLADKDSSEIKDTLYKRYERLSRRGSEVRPDDVYQIFINAYTASVEPHTSYFSPRNSEEFEIRMSLSLEGIGAVLRTENDHTVVQQVIAGGPAEMSEQLKPGDRIVGVGQDEKGLVQDVVGWRLDDVVDLIRGPKGTIVRLQILPKDVGEIGSGKVITLTRNKIKLEEQAAKQSVIELPAGDQVTRVGVITVPAFYLDFSAKQRGDKDYRSTTRDVRRLLDELNKEKVAGLVIDLRGNGGGSLTEATQLSGLFIESGPIVQVRDASGRIEVYEDPDKDIAYSGPMAVLVDRYSASASEIFAGAMQDYRRAIVIGEPTFGKGTVQSIVDLDRFVSVGQVADKSKSGLGQLKTTIAQFFRVSGSSTQHKGVTPDIVFPTAMGAGEHGERAEKNALPWDQVPAARFKPAINKSGNYSNVRGRHIERIKDDPGFTFLLAESAAIEKARSMSTVPLLATKRRAERDMRETERRERNNVFRVSRGLPPLTEEEEAAEAEADDSLAESQDDQEDAILHETAQILLDVISAGARTSAVATPEAETVKGGV